MTPAEYDVYLCCRDGDDRGLVSEVAEGLARLGSAVRAPAGFLPQRSARLEAIERASDFVLLSSPTEASRPASGPDSSRGRSRPRLQDPAQHSGAGRPGACRSPGVGGPSGASQAGGVAACRLDPARRGSRLRLSVTGS